MAEVLSTFNPTHPPPPHLDTPWKSFKCCYTHHGVERERIQISPATQLMWAEEKLRRTCTRVCLFLTQLRRQRWDLSRHQPVDQMEGDPAYQSGTKGKRVCSREERKKRKTSGTEEGPPGQQGRRESSSVSSASHGITLWIFVDNSTGEDQISCRWECFRCFVYMLLCDVTTDDLLCPAVLWPH